MQKDNSIDNIFKQRALKFGVKLPDANAAFDNIKNELDKRKKKRKRRFLIFFLSFIGVAVISLFLVFSNYNKTNETILTENKTIVNSVPDHQQAPEKNTTSKIIEGGVKENNIESKEVPDSPESFQEQKQNAEIKAVDEPQKEKTTEEIIKSETTSNKIEQEFAEEIKIEETETKDEITVEDKTVVKQEKTPIEEITLLKTKVDSLPAKSIIDSTLTTTEAKSDSIIDSDSEESLGENDSLKVEPVKKDAIIPTPPAIPIRKFTIGFSIGPGQAFSRSEIGNINESFIAQSSNDKAISNFNRNFYLKYQFSRRFSFSTGLSFFKIGHTAKFSIPNEYLRFVYSENFGHTSAGFYDIDIKEIEGILKSNDFHTIDCIRKFEDISLKINVTDIPLSLSYSFFERNKIKCEVIGGFNIAFLKNSNIDIGINNNYYSIGNMNSLRKSIYGFSTGLGFSYQLNRVLYFRLNPIYRRYFNSVSTDESFKYYPYTFSVNAGFLLAL